MITAKQQEEAREPERIRVCIRPGKEDWIGVAYAAGSTDSSAIHEYVPASLLSARDAEIRGVLEGLGTVLKTGDETFCCWCSTDDLPHTEHSPACLTARALWERVQGPT